jgi:hypothetical protein
MLIISITLLILVIIVAVIRETKPEHSETAKKIMVTLVILALINFVLTMMGIL